MKLTKYGHSCMVLEADGQALVIDPGKWSSDFVCPNNVVAVVVTHEHPDHFLPEQLLSIVATHPGVSILAHQDITKQMTNLPSTSVAAGETVQYGPFSLQFFGGQHALIHSDFPLVANLGVMVNDTLYHPGDSFTLPEKPVKWLALPVSAPWMKSAKSVDFARAVNAQHVFPVHDAILSDEGKDLADRLGATLVGESYLRLTEPVEL